MVESRKFDICIIGAGAGGLSVAAAASQMGAKVALIQAGKMGGDCLNYGCIPSKSLIAAAKRAEDFRTSERFGIQSQEPQISFEGVMDYVHGVIKTLTPHDSIERFTELGVYVVQGSAHFVDENTIEVNKEQITARRFVIASGSMPAIPPIQGLDQVPFYTNETIFDIKQKPEHLIIIGGGPIGCELAQAFLLLGTKVTVLEAFHLLPHDEQDLVNVLREHLIKQGLVIHENAKITKVNKQTNGIEIHFEKNGVSQTLQGSDLLIATGRRPNVASLALEAAGVCYSAKGIEVNSRLQTSNNHIYAIGDVIGGYQFTHVANDQAGIVIRNILFHIPARVSYRTISWVTYTDPELAHVGLSSTEAFELDPNAKILTATFSENDRAQTEHTTLGKIKVVTTRKGKVLGVTILGSHAGELLLPWIMVIKEKKSIGSLAKLVVPYPTLSEITKKVASEFYTPILFSKKVKRLVRFLNLLG